MHFRVAPITFKLSLPRLVHARGAERAIKSPECVRFH